MNLEWRIELVLDHYFEEFGQLEERYPLRHMLGLLNSNRRAESTVELSQLLESVIRSNRTFTRIQVYDSAGELLAANPNAEGNRKLASVEKLTNPKVQDRVLLFRRKPNGEGRLEIASAIASGPGSKDILGYLVAEMNLLPLSRLSERPLGIGKTEEVLLIRKDEEGKGEFVLAPKLAPAISASEDLLHLLNSQTSSSEKYAEAVDYRQVPVLAATRNIEPVDWLMVVKVDRDEVLKPLAELRELAFGLFLIVLLFVLAAAGLLAARFSRPIVSLKSMAKDLREGQLERRVDIDGVDELSDLGASFNTMAQQLEYGQKQLKAQVATLEDQKNKIAAMLNSSLDAVVSVDDEGIIIEWNPAAESMFGYLRDEALGKSLVELIVKPGERQQHNFALEQYLFSRESDLIGKRMEMEVLRKDGSEFPVELAMCASTNQDELVMTAFIKDISEEKSAREEGLLLSSILQNSEDAIIGHDLELIVQVWNDAATRLFGWTPEQAIGKPVSLIVPTDRLGEERKFADSVSQGQPIRDLETVRKARDGSFIEVSLSISPILDGEGRISGIAEIVRDIREKKLAEERFRVAVEAAPNAMIMVGADGTILLVNAHAEELFGYDREELVGMSVEYLVPESRRFQLPEFRRDFFLRPESKPMGKNRDLFAVRKDGAEFPVEVGLNPVWTREGMVVLGSVVDITERKRAENFMKAALREKELLLKEIHHRVKNNMQVISSLLRLQSSYVKDKKARQLFHQSDERVRSMALIHERLYRAETLADINLAEYISELVVRLCRSYSINSAAIKVETHLEPVRLGIDQAIPCGLLLNEFISNALKHAFPSDGNGQLVISLSEDKGEISLIISDDGKGVPEDFDLRHPSTLGFEIIRTLTEQLEGTLEVKRENGTIFILKFPHKSEAHTRRADNGDSKHLSM